MGDMKMKQIWKYILEVRCSQTIEMPADGKILCVQVQHDIPHIWVCVDPNNPLKSRHIRVYDTRLDISDDIELEYITSFEMHDGALVLHAFEEIEQS